MSSQIKYIKVNLKYSSRKCIEFMATCGIDQDGNSYVIEHFSHIRLLNMLITCGPAIKDNEAVNSY